MPELRFEVNGAGKVQDEVQKQFQAFQMLLKALKDGNAESSKAESGAKAVSAAFKDFAAITRDVAKAQQEANKERAAMERGLSKYETDLEKTTRLLARHVSHQRELNREYQRDQQQLERLGSIREKLTARMDQQAAKMQGLNRAYSDQNAVYTLLYEKHAAGEQRLQRINTVINSVTTSLKQNVEQTKFADRAVGSLAMQEQELLRTTPKVSDEQRRLGANIREIGRQMDDNARKYGRNAAELDKLSTTYAKSKTRIEEIKRVLNEDRSGGEKKEYKRLVNELNELLPKLDRTKAAMTDLGAAQIKLGADQERLAKQFDRARISEEAFVNATRLHAEAVGRTVTPLQQAKAKVDEYDHAIRRIIASKKAAGASSAELIAVERQARAVFEQLQAAVDKETAAEYRNSEAGKADAAAKQRLAKDTEWLNRLIEQGTPKTERDARAKEHLRLVLERLGVTGKQAQSAMRGLGEETEKSSKSSGNLDTITTTVYKGLITLASGAGLGIGLSEIIQQWVQGLADIEQRVAALKGAGDTGAEIRRRFHASIFTGNKTLDEQLWADVGAKQKELENSPMAAAKGDIADNYAAALGAIGPNKQEDRDTALSVAGVVSQRSRSNPRLARAVALLAQMYGYSGEAAYSLVSQVKGESPVDDDATVAEALVVAGKHYQLQKRTDEEAIGKSASEFITQTQQSGDMRGRRQIYSLYMAARKRHKARKFLAGDEFGTVFEFRTDKGHESEPQFGKGPRIRLTQKQADFANWVAETEPDDNAFDQEVDKPGNEEVALMVRQTKFPGMRETTGYALSGPAQESRETDPVVKAREKELFDKYKGLANNKGEGFKQSMQQSAMEGTNEQYLLNSKIIKENADLDIGVDNAKTLDLTSIKNEAWNIALSELSRSTLIQSALWNGNWGNLGQNDAQKLVRELQKYQEWIASGSSSKGTVSSRTGAIRALQARIDLVKQAYGNKVESKAWGKRESLIKGLLETGKDDDPSSEYHGLNAFQRGGAITVKEILSDSEFDESDIGILKNIQGYDKNFTYEIPRLVSAMRDPNKSDAAFNALKYISAQGANMHDVQRSSAIDAKLKQDILGAQKKAPVGQTPVPVEVPTPEETRQLNAQLNVRGFADRVVEDGKFEPIERLKLEQGIVDNVFVKDALYKSFELMGSRGAEVRKWMDEYDFAEPGDKKASDAIAKQIEAMEANVKAMEANTEVLKSVSKALIDLERRLYRGNINLGDHPDYRTNDYDV